MKKIILLVALFFVAFPAFSQTIIEDGQKVFGTWSKSKSPYIIKGEAIVPIGKTLKIKAGTVIKFSTGDYTDYKDENGNKNYKFNVGFLRVKGSILAKGKSNKLILFTHDNKYGKWGNLVFDRAENVYLEYCRVEYCQYLRSVVEDDNATGAVSFIDCSGTIKNSIITKSWSGINAKQSSSPEIINCTITDNSYGIESNSYSKIKVKNTLIWNNETQFYVNPGANVLISYSFLQDDNLIDGVYNKGNLIMNVSPRINSNLKLNTNSPCINAGEKGVDIGIIW